MNLSLLRRLVRTDDLVLEVAQADTAAGTEYAICYCRGKADPAMVRQVRQTLPLQSRSCCWTAAILYRASAQPGTAVHSGQLHPAPGGGFGQTM